MTKVCLVGIGMTPVGRLGRTATDLMTGALEAALSSAHMTLRDVNGLIAVPALSEPRFMQAHFLATKVGLLPAKDVLVRTIDTGGAGPISGILEGARMIQSQGIDVAAVVAGDAVLSMTSAAFLQRADDSCRDPNAERVSPVIPLAYDRVAQWHCSKYGLSREQLAMVAVLMSYFGSRCENSVTFGRDPLTLDQVLASAKIGAMTNLFECARRCDGGAAVILASDRFLNKIGFRGPRVYVLGGGEGSGPLYPPPVIDERMFSCEEAMKKAYTTARISPADVQIFGLYDCFPICFIRAVESCGLAAKGEGGRFVEAVYSDYVKKGQIDMSLFPTNTHGGLLAFGAPWETPSLYNAIEAYKQITGTAVGRQIKDVKIALAYGNGGVFSSSSVAVFSRDS